MSDNRLSPGESRDLQLRFVLPNDGANTTVRVDHVRISPENLSYHKLESYPARRTVLTDAAQTAAHP